MQYRPIELETDVVPHASGSACLRLANTHVLVGVKTEIDVPFPERPDEGKLEFFIDCSANATPAFEGRGGEELAVEISNSLARAYQSPQSFNLKALNIMPGQQCWKLYVDILILECGGNLFDAISLAVKAALHNTQIPQVKAVSVDGGQLELNLSDDPFDCWRLDLSQAPVLMTLCKVGEHCILDPTGEEETCCAASAVVAVTPQARVTSVFKTGVGSFNPQTLAESLKLGHEVGLKLNEALQLALQKEEALGPKREKFGFLK
ncbi:exosome complex component RRP42 isoform X2 [Bacillus rossius redtenbacheri]